MNHYQYFSEEWIISETARRVYRGAAVVSLTVYVTWMALFLYGPIPLLKQLLFVGVLATAINGTGMEFFLFRFDDSAAWKQILWFCALLFAPLGPALYCFLVYSRSKVILHALAIDADDVSNGTKRESEV
ncbi:MAG TPA: hypothetical protein VJP02_18185 [Candidatus Sulfotelmatobacter sp.]|nr:hypothetical protein [Candidatus Sulfotelmatobacter sp.]